MVPADRRIPLSQRQRTGDEQRGLHGDVCPRIGVNTSGTGKNALGNGRPWRRLHKSINCHRAQHHRSSLKGSNCCVAAC